MQNDGSGKYLTEDEVPGAKFLHADIAAHSVTQLRRWLKCRKLRTNGKKVELIERCQNCIQAGRHEDIDVAIDGGKWYKAKYDPRITAPVTVTATIVWGKFPSTLLPEYFSEGSLYHYFIECAPTLKLTDANSGSEEEEMGDASTSKPYRRGERYCESGHVTNVEDSRNGTSYIIRSRVKSSMKKALYHTVSSISHSSGVIQSGSCDCPQGALGRCSHVMALLLHLKNHLVTIGTAPITCTSQPRQWGLGLKKKAPQKVKDVNVKQSRNRKFRASWDPRCSQQRKADAQSKVNAILYFAERQTKSMTWQAILQFKYEEFSYSSEDIEVLKEQVSQLEYNISVGGTSPMMIPNTESQSESLEWFQWRAVLLTASSAKVVCGLGTPNAKMHYLQSHMWGLNRVCTKEMNYGSKNEGVAFEDYKVHYLDALYPGSEVVKTGLWLNSNFIGIGCSPDGIVHKNNSKGILEIKCPYILKDHDPAKFTSALTGKQRSNFCLCTDESGTILLKKEHAYMFQIQVGMAITQTDFCDFVVWSQHGLTIITIDKDIALVNVIMEKLCKFFQSTYRYEYFCQRTVRNLPPYCAE